MSLSSRVLVQNCMGHLAEAMGADRCLWRHPTPKPQHSRETHTSLLATKGEIKGYSLHF